MKFGWTQRLLATSGMAFVLSLSAYGQSSDQQFPTPVKSSEVSAVIKPRDIGDSRPTTHYYTFEGEQGDLFINVQSKNFTGDIDVFVVQGLRPLTKMVLYADGSETETGRVIYLRKHETIILRVQGRTPGDDDATYRIKFAGSFAASKASDEGSNDAPTVANSRPSGVQVNSVGTIIARPTPEPEVREKEEEVAKVEPPKEEPKGAVKTAEERKPARKPPTVKVTDPVAETPKRTARTPSPSKPKVDTEGSEERAANNEGTRRTTAEPKRPSREPKATPPDPMVGVNLSIKLKSGKIIERPMTEVYRFTVERAVLTVINRDGSLTRYQMVDVASVTIEPAN